jgi:acetyl esterase/lipase
MPDKTEAQIRSELKIGRLMTGYLPVKAVRWLQKLALNSVSLPEGVRTERVQVGSVSGEWFSASDPLDAPVILYLHGGGFVYGVSHLHRKLVAHLAELTGGRVLMIDYRLAPEHPFPAALDDCLATYEALLAQGIAPDRLVIAGDSAGGNLTLGTLISLRDTGRPLPSAGVCLSPPVDLREHDTDKWTNSPDALLHPRAVRYFVDSYVADNDPSNPLLSLVLADLRGLPPLFLCAGGEETLCADIMKLADVAAAQGAPLTLDIAEQMWHVWQLFYPELPDAVRSVQEIAAFIKQHTRQPAPTHP